MKYHITKEETVFDEHYKILKAEIKYDTFSGQSTEVTRFAFHRGDSAAIILYEEDSNSIILTKQFRYPTTKHHQGWLLELPAGSMEKDECPLTCITRETLEETGYVIKQPEQIFNFYTSPGGSTEKIYLFFASVTKNQQTEEGGGLDAEDEDIKLVRIPVKDLKFWLQAKITDAKTIIALQWFISEKI